MLWIYYLLVLLSSLASCFPTTKGKEGLAELLSENQVLSDNDIIRNIVNELKSLSSGNLSVCDQCTTRLAIGKSLSILKPDLVSPVFTQWCIDTAYWSNSTCISTFSRNTVDSSYTGTNFGHMLSLMDPFGYDGQLYCHFKESGQCPKPLTPNVTLSDKWPPKQPKHNVAPEPSWNDTFNVLHISDFHVELDYTVGSEVNCTNSMCCTPHSKNKFARKTESITEGSLNSFYNSSYIDDTFVKGSYIDVFKNTSVWTPATTFGSYNCDAPEILINSSMNSIVEYMEKNSLNYDFAIFTGDLLDHDEIKYTSYDLTVESEELVFRDMKAKLKNMPVYPVLGNHDMFPYGELAQENHGFSNLFTWNDELMADLWQQYGWIDFKASKYARKHYSGYSVETKRGLKIISLNSNTWYWKNHYAYWNASQPDTFGQFEFLINELVESEEKDQRVWIVAHIPFATDSLPLPANLFVEIVERFSPYTIAGIFFGHTHLDQFEVLYSGSGKDSKTIENVLNHAWISQAITPWIQNNPSWRYYTVDKKTFSIMDAYNFYTKLNETYTNEGSEPIWEFEYSSREGYNIDWPKTSPLNGTYWHLVAEKVRNSPKYRQIYRNYAMRFSPFVPNCFNSTDCENDYCVLTSFTVDEYQDCIEK
ncbi:LAFE_0A08394g1_1 [Lachancea fermentati]|uniref:LAFE_0A08394g1_1 n=1 Tax=Lachancea fermentati TaxID=4955 RepID=A0A1G4M7B5_LACFM|nr:LAFE_0A08394g1_1 [Lachancea fermentati]